MKKKGQLSLIVISLSILLFLVRCGHEQSGTTFVSKNAANVSKSTKVGLNDFVIEEGTNKQKRPAVAFDPSNKRFLVVWLEETSSGTKDIKGKWIFLKNQSSEGVEEYTFPVNIEKVSAFNGSDVEVTPDSLTGLSGQNISIDVKAGTLIAFFSNTFSVQSDVSVDEEPSPAVAFGNDYHGNQNFIVLWADYKNDGGSVNAPKLLGKVYDKNCVEVKKFFVAGTPERFYTYSSTIYNLKTDVESKGQTEPTIAFDSSRKMFVVAWIDKNNIESNYRFSPRKLVISALSNDETTISEVFKGSASAVVDDKIVVYRYFDINGNPVKDPNDTTGKRSIVLYSDVDVGSSGISENVKVTLTNLISYKFEKSPSISVDSQGDILLAFIGKQLNSTAFFIYSSDGFGSSYINRGPFETNVTTVKTSAMNIFFRKIVDKDAEKKLYTHQVSNEIAVTSSDADVDSFDIDALGHKFIILWSQNEDGFNKIKGLVADTSSFTLGEIKDIASDKNSYNPQIAVSSNGEVFIAYEKYDKDRSVRDVFGRYLLKNLDGDSGNFKITTGTGNQKSKPAVSADDNGMIFVVFEDYRNDVKGDIYGTFYTRKQPLEKPILFSNVTSLDFGNVYNSTSKNYIPITNVGNGMLNVSDAEVSLPFQTISSVLTIEPGDTKSFGVKFNPSVSGNFYNTITVKSDSALNPELKISVKGNGIAGITINTSNFKSKADIISDYYSKLTAESSNVSQPNYEWTLVKRNLPDGLSLDKNTGIISGKATKTGVFEFSIKVNETNSNLSSDEVTLTIEVFKDLAYAEKGSFKCFIATAAYGSYLDPHVTILRNFRDNVLLWSTDISLLGKNIHIENSVGKFFVKKYYQYSPPIAAFIAKHESLKFLTRLLLTPVVYGVSYFKQIFGLIFFVTLLSAFKKRKQIDSL